MRPLGILQAFPRCLVAARGESSDTAAPLPGPEAARAGTRLAAYRGIIRLRRQNTRVRSSFLTGCVPRPGACPLHPGCNSGYTDVLPAR